MSTNDWGDQLGMLAAGIGSGAADYELAKHDPKGYVSLQKWSIVIVVIIFIAIVVAIIIASASSSRQQFILKREEGQKK